MSTLQGKIHLLSFNNRPRDEPKKLPSARAKNDKRQKKQAPRVFRRINNSPRVFFSQFFPRREKNQPVITRHFSGEDKNHVGTVARSGVKRVACCKSHRNHAGAFTGISFNHDASFSCKSASTTRGLQADSLSLSSWWLIARQPQTRPSPKRHSSDHWFWFPWFSGKILAWSNWTGMLLEYIEYMFDFNERQYFCATNVTSSKGRVVFFPVLSENNNFSKLILENWKKNKDPEMDIHFFFLINWWTSTAFLLEYCDTSVRLTVFGIDWDSNWRSWD